MKRFTLVAVAVLCLFAVGTAQAHDAVVQDGDTIKIIASRQGMDSIFLSYINGICSDAEVESGDTLQVYTAEEWDPLLELAEKSCLYHIVTENDPREWAEILKNIQSGVYHPGKEWDGHWVFCSVRVGKCVLDKGYVPEMPHFIERVYYGHLLDLQRPSGWKMMWKVHPREQGCPERWVYSGDLKFLFRYYRSWYEKDIEPLVEEGRKLPDLTCGVTAKIKGVIGG